MINRASKIEREESLLNEKGTNLIDLKKVLIENSKNPLVYDSLIAGIGGLKVNQNISSRLMDNDISVDEFSGIVALNPKYVNLDVLEKLRVRFIERITAEIKGKGNKYISVEYGENGLVITRKFGFSINYAMREFRLTEEEAKPLMAPGNFMEQFAKLKLNSIFKDMVVRVNNGLRRRGDFKYEVSEMYYNEAVGIYDVDFRIQVLVSELMLRG